MTHESPTYDKPYPSWIKKEVVIDNEVVGWYWDAPEPTPLVHGKIFTWDEENLKWKEVE